MKFIFISVVIIDVVVIRLMSLLNNDKTFLIRFLSMSMLCSFLDKLGNTYFIYKYII